MKTRIIFPDHAFDKLALPNDNPSLLLPAPNGSGGA